MFVGHYSVAFALTDRRNKVPLWILFIAVMFLDYLWATLVLLGVEKLRVIPGFLAGSMIDAYYMPYSHGLVAALSWSALAALCYKATWATRGALFVGLAVFSHWILDFIAHPPDLAIYDDTLKVGLALWGHRELEFGLEIAILAVGIALYLKRNQLSRTGFWGTIGLGLTLTVVQVGDTFLPRAPLSPPMTAASVWIFYNFFVGLALLCAKAEKSAAADSRKKD